MNTQVAFKQLITLNLQARADAGNCLVMAQNITGAPAQNPSATEAANKTTLRHASRTMPNTVAVLWFEHWGTYGEPPRRANWGHVVVYVPGKGFASSSPNAWEYDGRNTGGGIYWYDSIADVEHAFNCSFRFWTEDINGRRVCKPVAAPSKPTPAHQVPSPEEDEMKNSGFTYKKDGGKTVIHVIANTGSGFYSEYSAGFEKGPMGGAYNNPLSVTFGTGPFADITATHAAEIKRACAEVRAARGA